MSACYFPILGPIIIHHVMQVVILIAIFVNLLNLKLLND